MKKILKGFKDFIGYQIIADFKIDNVNDIKYKRNIEEILNEAISKSGLKLVKEENNPMIHQFKPYGVTAGAVLEQSHLYIHTWPEYGCVTIDIFSCSGKEQAELAFEILKEKLEPTEIKKRTIYRVKIREEVTRAAKLDRKMSNRKMPEHIKYGGR